MASQDCDRGRCLPRDGESGWKELPKQTGVALMVSLLVWLVPLVPRSFSATRRETPPLSPHRCCWAGLPWACIECSQALLLLERGAAMLPGGSSSSSRFSGALSCTSVRGDGPASDLLDRSPAQWLALALVLGRAAMVDLVPSSSSWTGSGRPSFPLGTPSSATSRTSGLGW